MGNLFNKKKKNKIADLDGLNNLSNTDLSHLIGGKSKKGKNPSSSCGGIIPQ